MIRPINKDVEILRRKSAAASKKDIQTAYDLLDTLKAHQNSCVGMAANMIGINKRIIACFFGPFPVLIMPSRKSRDFSHGMDMLTQRPFGCFFFWSALYF